MSSSIKSSETVLFQGKKKTINEPMVMIKKSAKPVILPASEASPELFRLKGIVPFDLFPDELIIEEKRIIIKRNFFPFISQILTIPIGKLSSFEVTHSIFFSSIYLKWGGVDSEATFQWLHHKDAQQAKEIMDGIRLRDNESLVVFEKDKKGKAKAFQTLGRM